MLRERLESLLATRRCTLLAIGPVSVNCVDVTIALAGQYDLPLMLIASRRQVDAQEFGGGYVHHWKTPEFVAYVAAQDKPHRVILGRDHGGPWQNEQEVNQALPLPQAMDSAKLSFRIDIESGIQFVHIDTSLDIFKTPTLEEKLERVFELYEYCFRLAQEKKKDVLFEFGPFGNKGIDTPAEMEQFLHRITAFCQKRHLPIPAFIVGQTGTLVMETQNVGPFEDSFWGTRNPSGPVNLVQLIEVCNRHKIFLKEHNTDYLPEDILVRHPLIGIHSANIAPELGVTETRSLMDLLYKTGDDALLEDFVKLAVESGKWRKWMLPMTRPSPFDLAVIAGHYVFNDPRCIAIKEKAQGYLKAHGIDLEQHLRQAIREKILRYLNAFQLVDKETSA